MSDGAFDDTKQPKSLTASAQATFSSLRQFRGRQPRRQPFTQDHDLSVEGFVPPSRDTSAPSPAPRSATGSWSVEGPTVPADTEVDAAVNMGLLTEECKLNRSARHMRNLAEKMRRDKLNTYVSELAAIVPPVAESSKKVDKTSVLRLAANFIRMHNMLGEEAPLERLPVEAERGLLQTLGDKFLLVSTNTGKIVYVSDAVEQTFGHGQMELLGCSLYSFVHHDDFNLLRSQLTPSDNTRRSFFCRFAEKSPSRNETRNYDIIHVQGNLRCLARPSQPSFVKQEKDELQNPELSGDVTVPPTRHRRSTRHYGSLHISEDSSGSEECEEGRAPRDRDTHLLVALVHLIKERPLTELSRVESMRDEYITRHDSCGTIMYTDHRISYVTGYMPESVCGSSAFMYMHQNDLLWSMVAQKQMLGTEHGQGVVTYRLRCQDDSYVTLRSRGYLEFNKQTGQFESFVCINSVVDEKHSEDEIRKQRRQLLPVIAGATADDLISKLSPEFPVEIMEMVQNTLGQNRIRQLLAAISKFAHKKTSSRDGVIPATIREVDRDESTHEGNHVNMMEREPQQMCEENTFLNLSFTGDENLRSTSKKKKWVTLNKGSSFEHDCSGHNTNNAERMGKDSLKRNLPDHSSWNSYPDSKGINTPTNLITRVCGDNVHRVSSKRPRLCLSEELEDQKAGSKLCQGQKSDPTVSTPENVHFFESSSSNMKKIDDAFISQHARLEVDARRKKQVIQIEQMAYCMKQIHAHNSQPTSSPSVGIPERVEE